jgi:hypothetical protein
MFFGFFFVVVLSFFLEGRGSIYDSEDESIASIYMAVMNSQGTKKERMEDAAHHVALLNISALVQQQLAAGQMPCLEEEGYI